MIYILLFVAYAVFPLALAGYGAHLSAGPTTKKKSRSKQLLFVWCLAFCGVIVSGIAQFVSWRSDTTRDTEEQNFQTQTLQKLDAIIAEPNSEKKKLAAINLKQQLAPSASLPATVNLSHRERSEVINPNDISVVACNTPLKLNTEIHSSMKFDGPNQCTLIITSNSKVMLKNALLQIQVMPRTVKVDTVPPFTPIPGREMGDIIRQITIAQTIARGGIPFKVFLDLPRSSTRYGLEFQIITDDGRMLGWWGLDVIPIHETG